jgi:hypothetical protein
LLTPLRQRVRLSGIEHHPLTKGSVVAVVVVTVVVVAVVVVAVVVVALIGLVGNNLNMWGLTRRRKWSV